MTFVLALAISALAAPPAAPQQHCDIETRVWCLRATGDPVSMVTSGGRRVWTISDSNSLTTITVKESENCVVVVDHEGLETRLRDGDTIADGKRRPMLTFSVPDYECTVEISWDPLGASPERVRQAVLSAVWVGVGEKRPLIFEPLH